MQGICRCGFMTLRTPECRHSWRLLHCLPLEDTKCVYPRPCPACMFSACRDPALLLPSWALPALPAVGLDHASCQSKSGYGKFNNSGYCGMVLYWRVGHTLLASCWRSAPPGGMPIQNKTAVYRSNSHACRPTVTAGAEAVTIVLSLSSACCWWGEAQQRGCQMGSTAHLHGRTHATA